MSPRTYEILLLFALFPLLLLSLGGIGISLIACEMHFAAVDGMRDKQASADRQRWFYSYCRFLATTLRWIA